MKINLLSKQDRIRVQTLVDFYNRPANLRNPDSKKVKCHQCNTKMTLAEFRKHEHNFLKGPFESTLRLPYTGKRLNPHFSKYRLQLVERTRQLMPPILPDDLDAADTQFLIQETRTTAFRQLQAERKADAKQYRDKQKVSRRTNRG